MSIVTHPPAHPAPVPTPAGALARLRAEVPGVRGAIVATVDGRPHAAALPEHDEEATAAIVAASLGLGRRLAELTGDGEVQEIVVRSGGGHVVIYAVGARGVLTVLCGPGVNLARLHLAARQVVGELAPSLSGAEGRRR